MFNHNQLITVYLPGRCVDPGLRDLGTVTQNLSPTPNASRGSKISRPYPPSTGPMKGLLGGMLKYLISDIMFVL